MIEKVTRTIKKFNMLKDGDKVTAALSGGADSVCLLLILLKIKNNLDFKLDAFHVNHMIRGREADRDEEFCRSLCKKYGVEFHCAHADVPSYAKKSGKSLEEAARDIRYRLLLEHAESGKLATAHTASDNAETIIFNMARGSGIKGLCGIPPVRDNIIRPLIYETRADVENFLKEQNQGYVTDSTNLSDDYSRNRIRHRIIPEILKINESFFKTISANTQLMAEEDRYLQSLADKAYNKCKSGHSSFSGLNNYDRVIRKRCLVRIFREEKLPVSMEKINAADNLILSGGKINIIKNVYITSNKGILFIERTSVKQAQREIQVSQGEYTLFEGKKCVIKIQDHNTLPQPGTIYMDYDKISGCIILRGRNYGDKINLAGRSFTSSVKKILNERIDPDKRSFIHFLADDKGLIFMEGAGIAERVRADEKTEKILTVEIKDVI